MDNLDVAFVSMCYVKNTECVKACDKEDSYRENVSLSLLICILCKFREADLKLAGIRMVVQRAGHMHINELNRVIQRHDSKTIALNIGLLMTSVGILCV